MPKTRKWVVCQSQGFRKLDDAVFYCVYGKVFPNAKGRPVELVRKYKLLTGRRKAYKFYKCIEHRNCDHQLRIVLCSSNDIEESGIHSKEKDDSGKRRRRQKINKDVKDKIEYCIKRGIYTPRKIASTLDVKKFNPRAIYNQLSLNKKVKTSVKIGRAAKQSESKATKADKKRTRTAIQKRNRNARDRQRRKNTKTLRAQIRELLGSSLKPGASAYVTVENGQKICMRIPDNDEEMIKFLEDNNYKASNLSRSDLVLRYSYIFLAKNIHKQVNGKKNKTFGRKLIGLLKDDIQRIQMDGRAESIWTSFFKNNLRQQFFKVADISKMLDESVSQSINLNGWEDIRSLERNPKGGWGMLPSRAAIQKEQACLEAGCADIFNPQLSDDFLVCTIDPKSVIEELITNSIASKYGRTKDEIDTGLVPKPICFDGLIDGAKAIGTKTMVITLLHIVDKDIIKSLSKEDDDVVNADLDAIDWEGMIFVSHT